MSSAAEFHLPGGPPSGSHPAPADPATRVGDERRHPPGPASVLVTGGSGAMGLTGPWATLANVSAVVVIAFLTVSMYRDISSEMRESRRQFREDMQAQRDADARRTEAIVSEIRALTNENRALTAEIRASRLSIERTEQRIMTVPPKE